MAVTQQQLDGFYQIATDQIKHGGVDTPEDLFALWNLLHPSLTEIAEVNESIRKGEEDIIAGRGRPAREVTDEIRKQYGLIK